MGIICIWLDIWTENKRDRTRERERFKCLVKTFAHFHLVFVFCINLQLFFKLYIMNTNILEDEYIAHILYKSVASISKNCPFLKNVILISKYINMDKLQCITFLRLIFLYIQKILAYLKVAKTFFPIFSCRNFAVYVLSLDLCFSKILPLHVSCWIYWNNCFYYLIFILVFFFICDINKLWFFSESISLF